MRKPCAFTLSLSLALALTSVFFLAPLAAQASMYAPGQTLNPDCLPTDPPTSCGVLTTVGTGTIGQVPYYSANGGILSATSTVTILSSGNVGVGTTSPTAYLQIKAGTASANTAPLKFTSGTLLATPEAGAVEFLNNSFFGTITTGAARKTFAFLESPTFTGTVTTPDIKIGSGIWADVRYYGAVGDGITDDSTAINAALSAVGAAGGGTVFMPAGIYYHTHSLVVPSKTHLMGAGRGSTTVRSYGSMCAGVGPTDCGAIAMVGVNNAMVSDLTVDLQTNNANTRAIIMVSNYAGTPTTNSIVQYTEVLGSTNPLYLIWNQYGKHNKILYNRVDGGITTNDVTSGQDGIESYGGEDILIQGNTVTNIGSTGIWVFSDATDANSAITDVRIIDNYVDTARYGIGGANNLTTNHVQVKNNIVLNTWVLGIRMSALNTATVNDYQIVGNSVQNSVSTGILVIGQSGTVSSNLVVKDNVVSNITDANGYGIEISAVSDTLVDGNKITSANTGIYVGGNTATSNVVINNVVKTINTNAVYVYSTSGVTLKNNVFNGYNTANGGSAGVNVVGLIGGEISGNQFSFAGSETNPVTVDSNSSNVVVGFNSLQYAPTLNPVFVNSSVGGTANNLFGNTGIGTTTPISLLQIAGVTPKFTMSDTAAGVNAKHWFTQSSGGNFNIGTTSDSLSANSTYMTIANGGNVGVGTTGPGAKLHVAGSGALNDGSNMQSLLRLERPYNSGFSGAQGVDFAVGRGMTYPSTQLRFIMDNTGSNPANPQATVMTLDSSGNVGIGTVSPSALLNVYKNTATSSIRISSQYNKNSVLEFANPETNGNVAKSAIASLGTGAFDRADMVFVLNNSADYSNYSVENDTKMIIKNGGNVGVGTTSPYSRLTIWGPDALAGTAAFTISNSASTTEFQVFDNGAATLAGTLTQNSDQRLKQDITPLDASSTLAAITGLTPVSFIWRDPSQASTTQLGFIAQDVQQIFPSLVSTTSATALTPDGTLGLNYIGLIAPIVEAIKELAGQVSSLAATVAGFAQSFVSQNITATQHLCVKKSDGSNVCITGDELNTILNQSGQGAITITDVSPPTTYAITVTQGENGTISPDTKSDVASGANLSFTITPATGYDVATLLIDGTSIATSTTYGFTSVTGNHTIGATFVAKPADAPSDSATPPAE